MREIAPQNVLKIGPTVPLIIPFAVTWIQTEQVDACVWIADEWLRPQVITDLKVGVATPFSERINDFDIY